MTQKVNSPDLGSCKNGTLLEARLANVPLAQRLVATALTAAGLPEDRVMRAELVVEELFRNAVLHGYGGDSARPVWLQVTAEGFVFEDEAPPFDPLLGELVVLADQVGGAGLPLIRSLGRAASYEYAAGRNRVRISV
jgi:anti-sigma regulatory factor (Ser/Thr protein kinase)